MVELTRRGILVGIVASGLATALPPPTPAAVLRYPDIAEAVSRALEHHAFEPNDALTRRSIAQMLEAYMRGATGIYQSQVVCDEINNPPGVADASNVVVDVYFQPTRSVSYVQVRGEFTRE